ncbi:hypothetical protein [Streptomyces sp. DG1A-41]
MSGEGRETGERLRDGGHLLGPAQVQQAARTTEPVSAVWAAVVNRW